MRRREFITLVGGTVASWPLVAGAQSADRRPLVGFLEPISSQLPPATSCLQATSSVLMLRPAG